MTPCIGCGVPVPVPGRGRCRACQNPARRIRSAQAWRRYAETVRATGICVRCGTTEGPFEANHVTPLATSPDQVPRAECVCLPCHRAITRAQRIDKVM